MSCIGQKRNQSDAGIDLIKFTAAFFVVAIHMLPFEDVDAKFSYYFTNTICRVGVPFFFVCSGYYLGDKCRKWAAVQRYILRLIELYALWTLLYLPQILYQNWQAGIRGLSFGKQLAYTFFVTGSYTQFWYFPALIMAVLLLYVLKGPFKLPDWLLGLALFALYAIGVAGNAYYGFLLKGNSEFVLFYEGYFRWLETTRGGLFFGLPCLYLGCWIRGREQVKGEASRPIKGRRTFLYVAGFCICLGLMVWERRWLLNTTQYTMGDMTFAMVPAVCFLMKAGLCLDFGERFQKTGLFFRQCSTLIFCSHLLVDFYLHKALIMVGWGWLMEKSPGRFSCVCVGTFVFSAVIVSLSRKERWRILHVFY